MFCSRDNQLTTRFNQQNKKSTPNRRPYCRSRAGTRLFHRVYSIITHFASRNSVQSCIGNQYHHTTGLFNIPIKCVTDNRLKQTNSIELNSVLHNCRSADNKTQDIKVEITKTNLVIIALTDTWIKDDDYTTPTLL